MYVLDLKQNKKLEQNINKYYLSLYKQPPYQWNNNKFVWLAETFHCIFLPHKKQLVFKNKKHYTYFLLRWS